MMQTVTCTDCGWVHMAYTRAQAEAEVAKFNKHFDALSTDYQQQYYGGKRSSISDYEHCFLCGGQSFRPSQAGDCPDGVTIGPVIWEQGAE